MKTRSSVVAFMCAVAVVAAGAIYSRTSAQGTPVVTVNGGSQLIVTPGAEWATKTFQDPMDMSQYTDLSWWAYSNDAPVVDLSGVTLGTCTATPGASPAAEPSSSCFKATTVTGNGSQPNIWILETGNPTSADLHKNGDNFPIDANTYKTVAVRMRLTSPGSVCPSVGAAPAIACNTNFLWNQSNLYDGVGATTTNGVPTYDGWGIYFIDLTTIGANGPTPWSGTIRDLRLNLQAMAGANVEIDWIRLVPNNLPTQQIAWSGFGDQNATPPTSTQVDIYLDNNQSASDGNLGLIIQNTVVSTFKGDVNNTGGGGALNGVPKGSGSMTFQPGALAPGTYYVEICPTGTAPTDFSCKYSTGSYKVNDIPTITFTSPSPEGSSDDFATTVLNDPWDMTNLNDVDYVNNVPGLSATTITAVDEAGVPLNNGNPVKVLQSTGSAIGDPYLYALWYFSGRGQTHRIDANRYHILTLEAGIPDKPRDINGGSIMRIIWQVQGERSLDGLVHPRENVSDDIIFNSRAGANVMAKVTLDMKTLKLESDPGASPSMTGWNGQIESFRFDPHEFTPSTPFYLRRLKLAANEQTTGTYNIAWNFSNPSNPTGSTLALYYDTDTDPTTGLVPIASGVNPATGTYAWNTASVPKGTYYIYALVDDGTGSNNTNASYSRWPIVVGAFNDITTAPSNVHAAATKSGATLPFSSPAQDVTVTLTGAQAKWTATADQPWVQLTNASGTGSGRFTVAVANPSDVIGPQTYLTSNVTISVPSLRVSTLVPVTLVVNAVGATNAPFGAFDTPVSSATALAGSFAVTGWALDDVGIDHVEIWRDRVAGETTPVYAGPGPGNGKIFIANPLFVSGARTDVEAAYPNNPFASRAGWGYLLLSWGLWNQGNGPFTLYAFAYDVEGHAVTLGTKTIVADNANATKPFGGIDVPAVGQTMTASFFNFGWALTPNVMPVCTITDGNVLVGIDSGVLVPVTYGGNRTDIQAAFPGFSNGSNAGGAYFIDTSTLTNGTHQIGWLVTDNCGRADGIGSRFFSVLTGGSGLVASGAAATTRAEAATAATIDGDAVRVQITGGDSRLVYPNVLGTRVVGVGQSERVEVHLLPRDGASYAGYQLAGGLRKPLPLGSSLDASTGTFYWQPAVGFLGSFDLEFLTNLVGEQRSTAVRVVVGPPMRSNIDTPQPGEVVSQPFVIAGWAADLAANDGAGIDTVHVWAYPAGGGQPVFLGVAAYGDARADVGAMYGQQFGRAAYDLVASGLKPGVYDVVVYPHRVATGTFDGAQVVRIRVE